MQKSTLVSHPPQGLLRLFLRLPIIFYRLKLGWLLGERFVLLKHIGRKSGELRKTVVEVVSRDKASDTYFIVSGWGYKANWYRNLLAQPDIDIEVGRRKLQVTAETIPARQGVDVLLAYRKKHPIAARELSQLMGLDIFNTPPAELGNIIQESLPVIALRPRP